MKKLCIYLVLSLILLGACKKYEEGPGISLRSKEKRLCQEWDMNKWIYNGETHIFNAGYSHIYWDIDKNGAFEERRVLSDTTKELIAKWEWSEDKESMYLIESLDKNSGNLLDFMPFKNNTATNADLRTEFKIIQLKYDELIVEYTNGDKIIRMEFYQK